MEENELYYYSCRDSAIINLVKNECIGQAFVYTGADIVGSGLNQLVAAFTNDEFELYDGRESMFTSTI